MIETTAYTIIRFLLRFLTPLGLESLEEEIHDLQDGPITLFYNPYDR